MKKTSRTQIIATIGPSSDKREVIEEMIDKGMDIVRLNFSWGTHKEHGDVIDLVREVSESNGKNVLIIQDISGPRKSYEDGHHFDSEAKEIITEKDRDDLEFGVKYDVDYIAMSYVGSADDIVFLRKILSEIGSKSKIIAKIERKEAVENIEEIIDISDAIMIARGDLGDAVSMEKIPYVQHDLIKIANKKDKPVIVATGLMSSMIDNKKPDNSNITDITVAVLTDADAVMLSNETAVGKFPILVIEETEKILLEAEQRVLADLNLL